MTKQSLVSVIVANYNHSNYLRQALDSLASQTYPNLEIIFVDDASTDSSKEIVNEWSKNNSGLITKQIFLSKNMGKWFALNKGITEARGELVTLQDADDASCPTRIERQVCTLQEYGSLHNLCLFYHCYSQEEIDKFINIKYSGTLPVLGHKEVVQLVWKGFKTPGINHFYIGKEYEAHGASCLFYRQLWENGMRFLPGNLGLRCQKAEDGDFNTKMTLLLQKTSILLEKQYLYRRNTSTNNAWLEEK